MSEMWADAHHNGKRVAQDEMMPREYTIRMTLGFDDCKGCGAKLAYIPNVGEEAECPNCHMVHEIIDGGLLKEKV